jgi:hypothetical protein
MKILIYLFLIFFFILNNIGHSSVFRIGSDKQYKLPSEVMSLVKDFDIIEIDSGTYSGDVGVWNKNNLTIRGIGGLAHIEANGKSAQSKAIWVIQGKNTTVEYIEFSGCKVPDRNGAGIRQEGRNLTVRHCYFHDNEDGILTGADDSSNILIEFSEFARNGYGDGQSHNMYIGNVHSFTLKFCYSHHAKIGHTVKSRANANFILYNRIMDEETGNSSYLIDIPNGGSTYIIGNILMKGPNSENQIMISYGAEQLKNQYKELFIVNNSMVNTRGSGRYIYVEDGTLNARIINNIFAGKGSREMGTVDTVANLYFTNPDSAGFVEYRIYNYHLTKTSPAIDRGINPGFADEVQLTPLAEYIHPLDSTLRNYDGNMDIGAYEFVKSTSIENKNNDGFELEVHPNPVNEFSIVSYQLPVSGHVNIELYNQLGQKIADLVNGWQDGGKYNFQFPISDFQFSSGNYFLKMKVGNDMKVLKIIYISNY